MAEEIDVQGTENTALEQEKTFTQADVDKMIQTRLDRERKKYPSEEEITAYRTWKDGQQTEQERQAKRDKELADSKSALTAAQAEIEQMKRDKYVLSKGLTGDDAEFIAFKALKMVDDKTTFEQAVDKLTENRQKVKFDWTAPAGNGEKPNATNAAMNSLIRGALK
uniref:Major capsid protein n=1 Tax=Siphoviridae sp. ctHxr66 TaxID=2826237 RepID=A0A8S5MHE0_9CAUD|nr:MAG TPA: Major capsid protein [Siphoviridae sp. ctHxr66]DAH31738.1 MAG TPA: Major capsid protein [Caudoviricetes sp.]